MNKMILYRAISEFEKKDYEQHKFRCAKNTLEAKQFFKSKEAVINYVKLSILRNFNPPYKYIIEIEISDLILALIVYDEQDLDFYKALTIHEDYLSNFNILPKFETIYEVANYIHS